MFMRAVEALAQLLAYEPLGQPPYTLFCGNVQAMHALLNSTYNHNCDPPIPRICPHQKCRKRIVDIKTFAGACKPGVVSVSNKDLEQNFLTMQNYFSNVARDNYNLVDGIVANLAIAMTGVCYRIKITLPDKSISREDLDRLKNRVNNIYAIFDLVIQTDSRCRNVHAGNKIQRLIWIPKAYRRN